MSPGKKPCDRCLYDVDKIGGQDRILGICVVCGTRLQEEDCAQGIEIRIRKNIDDPSSASSIPSSSASTSTSMSSSSSSTKVVHTFPPLTLTGYSKENLGKLSTNDNKTTGRARKAAEGEVVKKARSLSAMEVKTVSLSKSAAHAGGAPAGNETKTSSGKVSTVGGKSSVAQAVTTTTSISTTTSGAESRSQTHKEVPSTGSAVAGAINTSKVSSPSDKTTSVPCSTSTTPTSVATSSADDSSQTNQEKASTAAKADHDYVQSLIDKNEAILNRSIPQRSVPVTVSATEAARMRQKQAPTCDQINFISAVESDPATRDKLLKLSKAFNTDVLKSVLGVKSLQAQYDKKSQLRTQQIAVRYKDQPASLNAAGISVHNLQQGNALPIIVSTMHQTMPAAPTSIVYTNPPSLNPVILPVSMIPFPISPVVVNPTSSIVTPTTSVPDNPNPPLVVGPVTNVVSSTDTVVNVSANNSNTVTSSSMPSQPVSVADKPIVLSGDPATETDQTSSVEMPSQPVASAGSANNTDTSTACITSIPTSQNAVIGSSDSTLVVTPTQTSSTGTPIEPVATTSSANITNASTAYSTSTPTSDENVVISSENNTDTSTGQNAAIGSSDSTAVVTPTKATGQRTGRKQKFPTQAEMKPLQREAENMLTVESGGDADVLEESAPSSDPTDKKSPQRKSSRNTNTTDARKEAESSVRNPKSIPADNVEARTSKRKRSAEKGPAHLLDESPRKSARRSGDNKQPADGDNAMKHSETIHDKSDDDTSAQKSPELQPQRKSLRTKGAQEANVNTLVGSSRTVLDTSSISEDDSPRKSSRQRKAKEMHSM